MKNSIYELKEVCLELTDICPLNCLHCSGGCGSNSWNMLPLHQIKKVIDEFSSMGGEILEISGGEPLVHPCLPQIIGCASKNNLETILYTSGNRWDAGRKIVALDINLTKKLRACGLEKVIFNLQGATPNVHDAITQVKGSFDNAVQGMKVVKSLGLWVGVHFVPMKLNYKEFRNIHRLCQDLEVDELGVLRFVPQGRGQINREMLGLSKSEFEEFNRILIELTSKSMNSNIRVGRPADFRFLFDPYFMKSKCDAGISRCLIAPNGRVVPCPAFKQNEKYVAGNVKSNSLISIWSKSPLWQKIRQFDFTQINDPCKSCQHLSQCKGGCLAQRVLHYKEINAAPDPCCFKRTTQLEAIHPSNAKDKEQLLPVQI
jgi:radical SAM protein with 4Fe4S-binding SPASM domain